VAIWRNADRHSRIDLAQANGGGAKAEIYLTTRWSSALPIRSALALREFGAEGLQSEKAVEFLNRQEPDYVVEVAGFLTTVIRQGAKQFAAGLLDSARLSVGGRRAIRATASYVPEHGMHLMQPCDSLASMILLQEIEPLNCWPNRAA
jgi:hypothetical protein